MRSLGYVLIGPDARRHFVSIFQTYTIQFSETKVKSFCKPLLMGLVIGVMTMLPIGKAYCQSAPEPAVVISIAKFKEQMDDVNYLLTASGFAQMKFMASAMIKGYTKGLDADKDAGVMLYFNEESETPDFLGFVPVSDIEEMLDVVAGMAEVEEESDSTTITMDDGTEIILREKDGFAFFSNKAEMLENLPEAPEKMLGDLPASYNFSAKVFAQRIPEKLRSQALDMIRDSSEMTLDQMDEGDLSAELQRKNLEMQMKQMEMVFNETDSFTIGLSADKEAKKLVMDVEFKGLPNSELAAKLAAGAPQKPSRFTGFLMDGATFTMNQAASMNAEDAAQYSSMLDDLTETVVKEIDADGDMGEEDLAVLKKSLGNLVDVLKGTLTEGIFDAGAVVMLEDGEINFAMAGQVSDPKKLEETVKELAALAEQKVGEDIKVTLNSGSHKDITLHTVIVTVPESEEEMRDALGDEVTLIVGIGDKAFYLAGGSNPVELLKKAVDGTGKTEDLMQMILFVTPILKFAANLEGDPNVETMANALAEAGGDRIRGTYNLVENGGLMRFEMQDGILGLIKVGFDAFSQGGGGFPGANDDF